MGICTRNGVFVRVTRNGLYPFLFVYVRFMFFKCSVYVHPPKNVTDGQRSLSSPESFEHSPNLELSFKLSEMECAGYTCSVVVRCVSCKCPQFVRYSFFGCSLCLVNICYSCASFVHSSVCVHYSFGNHGNIRLIDPFYVRPLFVATGPCSLQVVVSTFLCAVSLPNLTDC